MVTNSNVTPTQVQTKETNMIGPFAPITGGRVSEIVQQESQWCKSQSLPSSRNDDKIEKFCVTYNNFIDVSKAYERFTGFWEPQQNKAKSGKTKGILLNALTKSFYGDLLKAMLSKMVWSILVIFSIKFFVFRTLDFIKLRAKLRKAKKPMPYNKFYKYYLVAGFAGTMLLLSIGIQQMGLYSSVLGSKVKAALTTAIYKKMIAREAFGSKAEPVSLVAKDVEKIAEACLSLQYLWSGIAETITVFAILLWMIGSPIFPGLGLMCVFLPLQYCLGLMVAFKKKHLAEVSNKRISIMEEIVRGIKLIKIYGWEASFFENLKEVREEEATLFSKINFIKALILGMIFTLPPWMALVIFGTQEATGKIETVLVFTTLTFFNTLRVPFAKLPKSLRDVLDSFSCFERIHSFLLEPELANLDKDENSVSKKKQDIVFEDAFLSYGPNAVMVLNNINLRIRHGALVMVAGPVASGKSNLLKAILGNLTVRRGVCAVSSSKAYVPQIPWTAIGTVKDNIVFGHAYDEELYRKVIFACALEPDLKIMPDGDQTWIGERGGNLSGGQKQRIALARAAYSRADLYVLDSPLSAVDMYTCQHIFKHCIKDLMIGGGGTVILATHQTELFAMSDHLVVMENGNTVYNAKYSYEGIKHLFPNFSGEGDNYDTTQSNTTSRSMITSNKKTEDVVKSTPMKPLGAESNKNNIYGWYVMRHGLFWFIAGVVFFEAAQIQRVYSDAWITAWNKRKYRAQGFTSDAFYVGMYALMVHVFLFLSFLRAYLWFYIGKRGSKNIHDIAFGALLKAPMKFFHVTPVGKLLSFFSKDMDTIDDILVDNVLMFFIFTTILVNAIGVVVWNIMLFLPCAAGLLLVYIFVVRIFVAASVPLKKSAGQAQSMVIAQTAETLSGLEVVRAFKMEERFLNENLNLQKRSTVTNFSIANLALWLAFRVDIIGSMLVLACCLLAMLGDIQAAEAGLIVSNSFQILLFFSIMSRTLSDIHDNMGAVDRARTISEIEAEHEPTQLVHVPTNWPKDGMIQFSNVVMPYMPGTPPVLKGINFTIREGEKVGVVGRTGAGKSSLIVALYRLAEISEGEIHVDSIDCSNVNLNTLRSSMAIIPQEPVMFGGTIRTNLDPFNKHQDEQIKDVLRKCLLGTMVESEDGLETRVETLGSNISLGTQQLICLARAMLNPSRILLLDEATAALDSDTNAAVQHVLKAHFSDRTIFTIAHRLDTVIDSDRILVMNDGRVAEFDRPDVLLDQPNSIFRELCMNTGRAQFDVLAARARANNNAGPST